jgi:hypothetical protein
LGSSSPSASSSHQPTNPTINSPHQLSTPTQPTPIPKHFQPFQSTPLNGVDAGIVIAALHNHDLMIKTLCPALISYHLESGDKQTQATYSITDRKPIGQVSLSIPIAP